MNLSDLATFVQVAEQGTLTAAAKELGVPKSTVSRRVSRLEDALGVPLLVRSARSVKLTDDGRRLSARSSPALRELVDAERELTEARGEPSGRLRLTAPGDLAQTSSLNQLLASYRRLWPNVVLDITLTNRVVDLVEEGFDLAIRPNANMLRDAGTIMGRRLATMAAGIWASVDYVARAGEPQTPEELVDHDCILHQAFRAAAFPLVKDGEGEPRRYAGREALAVNDFGVIHELVSLGVGLGVIPATGRANQLEKLVRVLPRWSLPPSSLWLVWPASRHLSPRVRAFVDHAVESDLLQSL